MTCRNQARLVFLSKNRHYFHEISLCFQLFLRLSAGNPFEHKGRVPLGTLDHPQSYKVDCSGIPKPGWEKPDRKYSQNILLPKSLSANDLGMTVNKADQLQRIAIYMYEH